MTKKTHVTPPPPPTPKLIGTKMVDLVVAIVVKEFCFKTISLHVLKLCVSKTFSSFAPFIHCSPFAFVEAPLSPIAISFYLFLMFER